MGTGKAQEEVTRQRWQG